MTTVQVTLSDDEVEMFTEQAQCEGLSLEAWFRAAAYDRLAAKPKFDRKPKSKGFKSPEDVRGFFRQYSGLDGPETEPDWEEHLRVLNESRMRGMPQT